MSAKLKSSLVIVLVTLRLDTDLGDEVAYDGVEGVIIDANQSLVICAFRGPTQQARQGLVERWPKLYPTYDLEVDRVNRVVVTIEGQALE